MKRLAVCALPFVAIGAMGAAPSDLAQLQVLSGVKPGLWEHSFTTIPKLPVAPDQQEQMCVTAAQIGEMLEQGLQTTGEEYCAATVEVDGETEARVMLRCPPIRIPGLGIEAPGTEMPAKIVRSPASEHWVVTVDTPAVLGVVPPAVWRHEYRRLGACPG